MRPLVLTLALTLAASLWAESIVDEARNVPVDRLAANLTRLIKQNPRDLEARVNLARVYALAYAQKSNGIPAMDGQPWFDPRGIDIEHKQFEVKPTRDPKVLAAAQANLKKAIAAYRDVLRLDANDKVGLIGLGWCLSQAGQRVEATSVLRKAVEVAWRHESGPEVAIYQGGPGYVEEAARYLIPLLDKERDAAEIATLRDRIKKLESVPRWITPIVIPLSDPPSRGALRWASGLTALELVDDDASVLFDLDGTGPKRWTWITSGAAWLVYDHFGTGRITSGLQLFGNVTFWAFWQNGYHALRALDDDGDGEVRGAELRGLALWHDWNRNGVSERGEVRPVASWGIEALSTAYDFDATHPDEIPWSSEGVRLADGTVWATFDVVLRRAAAR